MEKKHFVLFDFDGVMVDTFDLCYGISRQGDPTLTEDAYRTWFDGNIHEFLDEKRKEKYRGAQDDDYFFSQYTPRLLEMPIIPGVRDAIVDLARRYTLVVVTSSVESPLEEYFADNAIVDCFAAIYGMQMHTSKVEKFRRVCTTYGVSAASCIFVTDTLGDIREATIAGVPSIGVSWGFHPRETLAQGKPATIIGTPSELVSAIDGYFGRP